MNQLIKLFLIGLLFSSCNERNDIIQREVVIIGEDYSGGYILLNSWILIDNDLNFSEKNKISSPNFLSNKIITGKEKIDLKKYYFASEDIKSLIYNTPIFLKIEHQDTLKFKFKFNKALVSANVNYWSFGFCYFTSHNIITHLQEYIIVKRKNFEININNKIHFFEEKIIQDTLNFHDEKILSNEFHNNIILNYE